EAGGAVEEQSPPPPATSQVAEDGPVVRLFDAITGNTGSTVGQMRQVVLIVLGIGFLTAAGFIGATLHSRRGPRWAHRRRRRRPFRARGSPLGEHPPRRLDDVGTLSRIRRIVLSKAPWPSYQGSSTAISVGRASGGMPGSKRRHIRISGTSE